MFNLSMSLISQAFAPDSIFGKDNHSFDGRSAVKTTCGCRIVISPIIPYDSPPCYYSSMRHLVVLFIHLIAILTQL
jgi:hypothetical protein